MGARAGKTSEDVTFPFHMRFELAKHEGEQMCGILLDQIKCFDRLVPSLQLEIQRAFGAPEQLVKVRTEYYKGQVHAPKVG
eukprot:9176070-Alexandrium_andersonii.AAC.1